MSISPALGPGILGRDPFPGTDCRDLHNLSNTEITAGIKKCSRSEMMDGFRVDAGSALQYAGAVYDRVHALQAFTPDLALVVCHEVAGNSVHAWPAASKARRVPDRCGNAMARIPQGAHQMAPHETIGPCQKNLQRRCIP